MKGIQPRYFAAQNPRKDKTSAFAHTPLLSLIILASIPLKFWFGLVVLIIGGATIIYEKMRD